MVNDWYYCRQCSSELKQSNAKVESYFDDNTNRVNVKVYCTQCNSEEKNAKYG